MADMVGLLLIAPTIRRNSTHRPTRQILIQDATALAGLDRRLRALAHGLMVVQDLVTLARLHTLQAELRTSEQDDIGFVNRLRGGFAFDVNALPQKFDRPT